MTGPVYSGETGEARKAAVMTRQERRAKRLGRFVTAREARWAARLAHLGYKTSGETGALKPPAKVQVLYPTVHRASATYIVEAAGPGRLAEPVIHHRWRKLMAEGLTAHR